MAKTLTTSSPPSGLITAGGAGWNRTTDLSNISADVDVDDNPVTWDY